MYSSTSLGCRSILSMLSWILSKIGSALVAPSSLLDKSTISSESVAAAAGEIDFLNARAFSFSVNTYKLMVTTKQSEQVKDGRATRKIESSVSIPAATDNWGVGDLRGDLMGVGIPDARRPPPVLLVSIAGGRLGVDCFVAREDEDAGEVFFPTLLLRLLLDAASCF